MFSRFSLFVKNLLGGIFRCFSGYDLSYGSWELIRGGTLYGGIFWRHMIIIFMVNSWISFMVSFQLVEFSLVGLSFLEIFFWGEKFSCANSTVVKFGGKCWDMGGTCRDMVIGYKC